MLRRHLLLFILAIAYVALTSRARADVFHMDPGLTNLDFVTVGNPGNAPDTRYNGVSVGSVDHVYQIGKYEITAGQYTEFLNAVAKADPNGLYNVGMGDARGYPNGALGANIQRHGSSPNFNYSVAGDWANRPVGYVSFWDAARFANWLDNGQPTGPQSPGTTEGGAYHDVGDQMLFGRNLSARFFVPTLDEWYKAAYHNKSAGLAASYFDYPTRSNTAPINTLPDLGNHANFYDTYSTGTGDYSINGPYYRTEVGAFVNSASPYGTFDQAGNVFEWDETAFGSVRGRRGGAFDNTSDAFRASNESYDFDPSAEDFEVGFRVASLVPALPGDYDGDGYVGPQDLLVWRANFGTNFATADGNSDGVVDAADYTVWRDHLGNGTPPIGAAAAVPEPNTAVLAFFACGMILLWRSYIRP